MVAIALALSLAAGKARDLIIGTTSVVVNISILAQGFTIESLVKS
jgi:NhaP-type Na+/H+ or K+/H+ antiporter